MLFSILAVSHGFGEAPKVRKFKDSDGWYSQWHKKINILYTDEIIFQRAYQFFCQYESLSITDSVIVAFLEELDEKIIYSFDSGFDKIDWIKRKEN